MDHPEFTKGNEVDVMADKANASEPEQISRRQFLVAGGAAGAAAIAGAGSAAAQAPASGGPHVKAVPPDLFISHGINQETRLETLSGYITPSSHFFVRNHTILTRAVDDQGNTQPPSISWNAQGYGYNVPVPHPVKIT
jgi:hypothetical protein